MVEIQSRVQKGGWTPGVCEFVKFCAVHIFKCTFFFFFPFLIAFLNFFSSLASLSWSRWGWWIILCLKPPCRQVMQQVSERKRLVAIWSFNSSCCAAPPYQQTVYYSCAGSTHCETLLISGFGFLFQSINITQVWPIDLHQYRRFFSLSVVDKLKHTTVRPTAAKRSSFVLPSRHWDGTTCFVLFFFSPQSSGTNQTGVKLTTRHLFIYVYIYIFFFFLQVAVSHYETNSTLSKSEEHSSSRKGFLHFPGL